MSFFKCPRCKSDNVKNFHLNTDEYGYPTDATAQGCCYDCNFEEPYFYNEKSNFYYTEYPINIGNGYVPKKKTQM